MSQKFDFQFIYFDQFTNKNSRFWSTFSGLPETNIYFASAQILHAKTVMACSVGSTHQSNHAIMAACSQTTTAVSQDQGFTSFCLLCKNTAQNRAIMYTITYRS